ncbi:MAG: MarR family transcriptional regulator [Tardiphaga sp.]|jgi:DNA-binding HxlR family transcriptional regulator|uniref:winged helix-turn-helix transcriptional regulator n=1 Tax=Tardiphaga sp. TaxID=1926292 RepID=UPI00261F0941|nr:helix-turn-helix domain-containing protein [Tardiphaga sp.]MDB5502258.1 MarR family transcriptional regulator [Tardiphaga sp.]
MKNVTIETDGESAPLAGCPETLKFRRALGVLAGKWKGEILWELVQSKRRFGELRRSIPGVTQHMLTIQLRDLEANGLVKRTIFAEVPPRVEYEITPAAKALKPVFDELLKWSQEHGFPTGPQATKILPDTKESRAPRNGSRL